MQKLRETSGNSTNSPSSSPKCRALPTQKSAIYRKSAELHELAMWVARKRTRLENGPTFYSSHNSLRHTASHCTILQHTATHCSTLQHIAPHCNTLQHTTTHTTTHYSTLQHYATNRNPLQHTSATHFNTLQPVATRRIASQHTATYCNTLQRTAAHCNTQVCAIGAQSFATATHCTTLQHPGKGPGFMCGNSLLPCFIKENSSTLQSCNNLRHPATYCNTLQHIATH